MAKRAVSANIVTPVFTASFPAILEKKEDMGGKEKYSVTMLFPKASTDINKMGEAIKKVAVEAFGKEVNLAFIKTPIHDGDKPNTKGVIREEQKGHWVIRASSNYKPGAFRADKSVIQDEEEIYGGIKAVAIVNFFSFDRPDSRGVTCGLRGITKLSDGAPLNAGSSVNADEFGELPAVEGSDYSHTADWMN